MEEDLGDTTTKLDEYIGILVVDVRHYCDHNENQQKHIDTLLAEILQQAADRAGLPQLWRENEFLEPRGDGYLIGFDRGLLSAVVDRFFDALQIVLRRAAPQHRAAGLEVRLRASLDLGPVESFNALLSTSSTGEVMVNVSRMIDSREVRKLLDETDPAVTFVASVLSRSVMDYAIAAGKTVRRPSEFVDTRLHVEGKNYTETGYLRVPAPSGELLRSGLLFEEADVVPLPVPAPAAVPPTEVSNVVTGPAEKTFQARDVEGGIRDGSVREVSGGLVVTGDGNTTAGRDQLWHHQEFSGKFRTQGDGNFGLSSGSRAGVDDASPEVTP